MQEDFYNFDIGDKFCQSYSHDAKFTGGLTEIDCYKRDFTITGKTQNNSGITYYISDHIQTCPGYNTNPSPQTAIFFPGSYLSDKNLLANSMYPDQFINSSIIPFMSGSMMPPPGIVHFGLDNKGTFYKYAGPACGNISNIIFPSSTINSSPYYGSISEFYGVGLGTVNNTYNASFGYWVHRQLCQTCAVKNSTLYYGTETFVGLKEELEQNKPFKIFPNPNTGKFYLDLQGITASEILVRNILGQPVTHLNEFLTDSATEIDISIQPTGVYFVQVLKEGRLLATEKIVKN